MKSLLQSWKHVLRQRSPLPRRFSLKTGPIIPSEILVEEETLPYYEPQQYYPVHIGDVYRPKYQIVGKLGYSAYSTVWLCRDLW